jgi:hypothetical protein
MDRDGKGNGMDGYNRFDVSDAESDFGTVATIAYKAGGRYGIEARPWKRPELFGAGYLGLDLFSIEVGIEGWWSVVNMTPTGWDRTLDGSPVGMRTDDPRWIEWRNAR